MLELVPNTGGLQYQVIAEELDPGSVSGNLSYMMSYICHDVNVNVLSFVIYMMS